MCVLSIDWDYFFPDPSVYDWGANEEMPFMLNGIWQFRCNARNLFTGDHVLDNFFPCVPFNFWDIVENDDAKVLVAESHKDILEILEKLKYSPVSVVNIDAHHDLGYWENQGPCCGSWGQHAMRNGWVQEFHQVYPKWRTEHKEPEPVEEYKCTTVSYKLPEPAMYNYVFICRSGCWTPPWFDEAFIDFFDSHDFFERTSIMHEAAMNIRSPSSLDAAREIAEEHDKMLRAAKEAAING